MSLGKIYIISSVLGDCCYIGKTTKKYVSERIGQHSYDFRNKHVRPKCSSFDVLKYDDVCYDIIEFDIPIEMIKERESHFINFYHNSVNKKMNKKKII